MAGTAYDPNSDYAALVERVARPVFFSKLAALNLNVPNDRAVQDDLFALGERLLVVEQVELQKQASAQAGSLRGYITELDQYLGLDDGGREAQEETAKAAAAYLASGNDDLTALAARFGAAMSQIEA